MKTLSLLMVLGIATAMDAPTVQTPTPKPSRTANGRVFFQCPTVDMLLSAKSEALSAENVQVAHNGLNFSFPYDSGKPIKLAASKLDDGDKNSRPFECYYEQEDGKYLKAISHIITLNVMAPSSCKIINSQTFPAHFLGIGYLQPWDPRPFTCDNNPRKCQVDCMDNNPHSLKDQAITKIKENRPQLGGNQRLRQALPEDLHESVDAHLEDTPPGPFPDQVLPEELHENEGTHLDDFPHLPPLTDPENPE